MGEEVYSSKRMKASDKFVFILAFLSIVSFASIVSETLFGYIFEPFIEAVWFLIIGVGFLIEGQVTRLKRLREEGLTPGNFTRMVTIIIGLIAVIAGILSLPQINIQHSSFLAVKGIIALISIFIIIIQTWVVRN